MQPAAAEVTFGGEGKPGEGLAPAALAAIFEVQAPSDLSGVCGQDEIDGDRSDAGAHHLHRRERTQPFVPVKLGERRLRRRVVAGSDAHRGKQTALCFGGGRNDLAAGIPELGLDAHPFGEAIERTAAVLLAHPVFLARLVVLDRPAHRQDPKVKSPCLASRQITRPADGRRLS